MKKFSQIALAVLIGIGLLTGCGGQSYEAETSTVFVLKDGKVVSTDVEAFDENIYDKEGLESYVQEAVEAYNNKNGDGAVTVKSLEVEESSAVLILEYASASDYARFNGIEFYTGSLSEALSAGYAFDVDFCAITDGSASACSVDDFLGNGDYSVVIIRGNTNVHVAGRVAYVSAENTAYVDENTIRIQEGVSLLGEAVSNVENTEGASEPTEGTEEPSDSQAQIPEDDGSVSDDDLLLDTEETVEVFFTFDEGAPKEPAAESGFSQVYTYIIYR